MDLKVGLSLVRFEWASDQMALNRMSAHRTLKPRGRVVLVETGHPTRGIGYPVRIGSLALWSADAVAEAEAQFEQATK